MFWFLNFVYARDKEFIAYFIIHISHVSEKLFGFKQKKKFHKEHIILIILLQEVYMFLLLTKLGGLNSSMIFFGSYSAISSLSGRFQ